MDKQILLGRYQSARSTLLVATILTAINTILLLVGLDYYLIYSLFHICYQRRIISG